jgi:phosphohistidine phosphatase
MTMEIYLVRHAEAADKADDPERNLTEQGRRDAAALAAALRPLRVQVSAIWHSGKPRARQTAEAMLAAIASPCVNLIQRCGLKPMSGVKRLARLLDEQDQNVMIVGHEPMLGRLAARLVTDRASTPLLSLDKPSAVCLQRDDFAGQWRVAWMISKAMLNSDAPSNGEPVGESPATENLQMPLQASSVA